MSIERDDLPPEAGGDACQLLGRLVGVFTIECRDANGDLRWTEVCRNLITAEGKTDFLNVYLRGSAATTSWYVGLKDAAAVPNQADTLASKGWGEFTAYTAGARQAFTPAAPVTSGASPNITATVTNNASQATFTINATATAGGFFIAGSSTKGGTTGILLSVVDFAAARALLNLDTITVRYDLTI